jgi:hypothetical protein
MYFKQLNSYVLEPHTRIADNLLLRQTATIAERETELKRQIKDKNVFFGGQLDAFNKRFDDFETEICAVIDEKFDLLMEKNKMGDIQDSDYDSDNSDSDDSGGSESESETESEPDTEPDSSDDESDDENVCMAVSGEDAKKLKRQKYLKKYHQQYYLRNKAKNQMAN